MRVHLFAFAKIREKDGATALRGVQGQLFKGEDFASGLKDMALDVAAHS